MANKAGGTLSRRAGRASHHQFASHADRERLPAQEVIMRAESAHRSRGPGASRDSALRLSASSCESLGNDGIDACTSTTKGPIRGGGSCACARDAAKPTIRNMRMEHARGRMGGGNCTASCAQKGPVPLAWTHALQAGRRHVRARPAHRRENRPAHRRVHLPHRRSAPGRQARAGAAQPVRPGGAADHLEHGSERDHRRGQQRHRRNHRRRHAAGRQLRRGEVSLHPRECSTA